MRSLVTSLVAGTRMRDGQLGGGPGRFGTILARGSGGDAQEQRFIGA